MAMERWATKDHYELETEEADRLVRPAPKVKPPRRDKRREDTQPDVDPDIDTDPDVARDKDLSQNYKSIGGSLARIVARFQRESREWGTEESRSEYLQKHPEADPSKHTVKTEEEGAKEDEPEGKGPAKEEGHGKPSKPAKDEEFYQDAGRELYDAAKGDLHLKGMLKQLRDPEDDLAALASTAGTMPVAPFLKGKKVPAGIETLGDLQQAALHGFKAPPKRGPAKSEAPKAPAQGEAPKTPAGAPKVPEKPAAPKVPEKPAEGEASKPAAPAPPAPEKPAEAPKGEAKPAEGEAPQPPAQPASKEDQEKAEREAQAKKVVEQFQAHQGGDDPDWNDHLDALPTTTKNAQGKIVFIKGKKEIPFDALPDTTKAKLIESFETKRHGDHLSAILASKLQGNPKAKAHIEGMFDPESDISEKIAKLKMEGHDLDSLPVKKNLPELAGVVPANIKTVGDFQKLVASHPDLFQKKKPFQVWEKENGPESEDFKKYAEKVAGAKSSEGGELLFKVNKKNVPWGKLSDDQKAQIHDAFQKHEKTAQLTEDFREAARHDPDISYALNQLGNPRSEVAAKLARVNDLSDPIIDKVLPALRNLALPPGATMADVVEIAKQAFKPVAPPIRREASKDEQQAAQFHLKQAFSKFPILRLRVQGLNLHPDDVSEVLGTYQRLKSAKIKPTDLEGMIEDAQKKGLYTTDPSSVIPPKSGRNKNGHPTPWKDLTPEEQSEAYARHRNEVIATTLALRDMVGETFQELGVPKQHADMLALARLSRIPGETHTQRALRARPMASKVFDSMLESNARPAPVSDEDIEKTMRAIGNDPLARSLAVAQFQANDYLEARAKFLDPSSPTHTDERDPVRNIAARIRDASDHLRNAQKRYPVEYREANTPEMYRRRVMSRLTALTPEKAAEILPEIQKMDADDYDKRASENEEEIKKYKKEHSAYEKAQAKVQKEFDTEQAKALKKTPYRGGGVYIKSVKDRLAEAGVQEPLPPRPPPSKPPGYDLVRKTPQGQSQSGKSLWRRLQKGLTASERVVDRFLGYSSCTPGTSMGAPTSLDKTGVYWGVDPNDPASKAKQVNVPYTPWQQAHARDLSEKDYAAILASAREWMKVPVLARIMDEKDSLGAVRDIQLRAALDLAIRDLDGGKYSVGLYPTVYNNLLAQLGGQPEKGTLLTQREASVSLYTSTQGEDRPMNAAAEIRKFAAEIAATQPGLAFDLTNLAFRVAEQDQQGQGQGQQQDKEDKKPDFLKDKEAKYAAVKGAIIRVAATNPAVRTALVPVLQLLKQQG